MMSDLLVLNEWHLLLMRQMITVSLTLECKTSELENDFRYQYMSKG